jgi:unsaturated chondroitin disaccharide hydrolase
MSMRQWANETFDRAVAKFRRSAELAARQDVIPYKSEGGLWAGPPFDGDGWWTNGFWPALMWQLYAATGEAPFLQEARRVQRRLIRELDAFTRLNHDVGFMYLLSAGADYKLTGDGEARVHALHAATILAGRFNPLGFIRAWNQQDRAGWAIIDCLMNLPILYWASEETGDPRFAAIARIHTQTTVRHFLREDGSCHHIVIFDPATGEVLDAPAGQGCRRGSSWSRGQAWALYGFVLGHMASGEASDLMHAERVARYFIGHIRPDGLTDCDFMQPPGEARIDNIAGAIAACALIELHRLTGVDEYGGAALRLLRGIDEHSADWSEASPGILAKCTAAYHDDGAGRHINILYGDYFFVEALAKLRGIDPMFWLNRRREEALR